MAKRLLRLRLSARYRTEHGDDDPETGLVQVRFHDGQSFNGEETHRGHPLGARTARWVTSWISAWFVIHWAMPPGFVSFVNDLFRPDGKARIRAVSRETRSAVPSIVRTGIVA